MHVANKSLSKEYWQETDGRTETLVILDKAGHWHKSNSASGGDNETASKCKINAAEGNEAANLLSFDTSHFIFMRFCIYADSQTHYGSAMYIRSPTQLSVILCFPPVEKIWTKLGQIILQNHDIEQY